MGMAVDKKRRYPFLVIDHIRLSGGPISAVAFKGWGGFGEEKLKGDGRSRLQKDWTPRVVHVQASAPRGCDRQVREETAVTACS